MIWDSGVCCIGVGVEAWVCVYMYDEVLGGWFDGKGRSGVGGGRANTRRLWNRQFLAVIWDGSLLLGGQLTVVICFCGFRFSHVHLLASTWGSILVL
jgi:hypothetical protein